LGCKLAFEGGHTAFVLATLPGEKCVRGGLLLRRGCERVSVARRVGDVVEAVNAPGQCLFAQQRSLMEAVGN
jgi:hypothetical protein